MPLLSLIIIMSAATYRIGRFLILDSLIEEIREKFHGWLTAHPNWFTIKLQTLMLCPYCLTVWVAAGVVGAVDLWGVPLPLPVLQWLAVCAGALVFWNYIDAED